jgi:two-component system, OmpR family, sensor histidine kinase KdpD
MRWQRLTALGGGYPFASVSVLAATLVLLPLRGFLSAPQFVLLFVPVIVAVARLSGVRVSAFAGVLALLALDLLFIPPYYQLQVASPTDWVTLAVFLVIAVIVGQQAGRMRGREQTAVRRQRELESLNRMSARLVSEESVASVSAFVVSEVVAVLGARRAALYARRGERAVLLANAGAAASGFEQTLADWVTASDKAIAVPPARGTSQVPRPVSVGASEAVAGVTADAPYLPLQTADGLEGVLYARPASPDGFTDDEIGLLVAVSNLTAAFLERRKLEEGAALAAAERESDRLKATIVSSVSHELKTPLAAVTARVTGLLEGDEARDPERVASELSAVSEDLGRLDASIRDLVDVSRLESDAWRPQPADYDIGEVLGTVASKVPAARRGRLRFDVPEGLSPVSVDFNQMARALSNVIDNALVYSPEGTPVTVSARRAGAEIHVAVSDAGAGVPDEEKERVFEKFYRGSSGAGAPMGTGLGLAITREIVKSHGGRVWVEDAQPHGARYVIALPTSEGTR